MIRGPLPDLAARFADAPPPKGEIVLLVGPPSGDLAALGPGDLDRKIDDALTRLSVKDASAVVAAETGLPRRQVYARAVERMAGRRDGEPA